MNSRFEKSDISSSDQEELSAYLDGELGQDEVRRVESRLGSDTVYLEEMQSLQKTWDILDELPLGEPSTSFTKTTMEIVVNEAKQDSRSRGRRNWIALARVATVLVTVVLFFGVSFWVIRVMQAEPDRFLVEHLSAIENFERFAVVENDLNFLERLSGNGHFAEPSMLDDQGEIREEIVPVSSTQRIPEKSGDKRSYVASLDAEKKMELQRKLDEFVKFSTDQQDRIVEFDQRLQSHADVERLTKVLRSYYGWLRTLEQGERSRLLDLKQDERIASIVAIRDQQAREAFGRAGATQLPSVKDAEVVYHWFNELIKAKENKIRLHFPRAIMQFGRSHNIQTMSTARLKRIANSGQLNVLVGYLVKIDRKFVEDLVFRDLEVLAYLLSPEAKTILEDRTVEQQRELVLQWVVSASQARLAVSRETLRRFARTLTLEEQDELDKLSSDSYFKSLNRKYRDRQNRAIRKNANSEAWDPYFDFGR